MKNKYKLYLESNLNVNYQYERNVILNKYRVKLIQIQAKIMQLVAKSKELSIQMQEELSNLNRDFQKSVNQNIKHSTIPTTTQLMRR